MSRPKLVLFDEPSMGLAPVIVAQVFDLVRRIRSEGYTVLIVEQNVRQVLKFADRGYLLEAGRMVMSGTAQEMLKSDEIQKAYMGI
jgi:branched-chain amino acid transport system ATP-binding protein